MPGVYIQDTDGVLWTSSAWDGSATPNGIAFITEVHSFVSSAFSPDIEEPFYLFPNGVKPSSLSIYSTAELAVTDFDGEGNTDAWLSFFPDVTEVESCALNYCSSYIFPNGQGSYIGAAGELDILLQNVYSYWGCALVLRDVGNVSNLELPLWSSTIASMDGDWGEGGPTMWVSRSEIFRQSSSNLSYLFDGGFASSAHRTLPFTTLGAVNGIIGEFEAVIGNKLSFTEEESDFMYSITAVSQYPVSSSITISFSVDGSSGSIYRLTIPVGSSKSSSSFTTHSSDVSISGVSGPIIDTKYYYYY